MGAESVDGADGMLGVAAERLAPGAASRDRTFWTGFAFALMLHASLLIGFGRARPREVGADKGTPDAIAVSLLTEDEFRAETSTPPAPRPAPGPPAATVAPPPKPTEPQEKPKPPVEPPAAKAADKPAEPAEKSSAAEKPDTAEKPTPSLSVLEDTAPDLFSLEPPKKPVAKPDKPETAPSPAKPPQKTAKLDATPPSAQPFSAPPIQGGGRAGSFARPPGITKSGWNDAFARGVIRALQMTMPQMRALGRVTVRILLDQNGNVKSVDVVRPSPDSNLNQSVVFAARQTSYPLPPAGATVADRTFLVTYIYN